MISWLLEVKTATDRVFAQKKYLLMFSSFTVLAFLVYILLPVYTVPGNDLQFWLNIVQWSGYVILAIFSIAFGLLITMKIYETKHPATISQKAGSAGGVVATAIAGLYSTTACGACFSTLFAFAGAGTVVFISQNRDVFMAISALITFYAIYLSARSINGHCKSCKVTRK